MPEIASQRQTSFALKDLDKVAQELISYGKDICIWLFYGDLGAGKTTLIKEICKAMGVDDHLLGSPTFSIINEYSASQEKIYHFDFYRIKNVGEIYDLGIEEYFDSGQYCFIEWPDRLEDLMPDRYFKITLTHNGEFSRTLEYQKYA